MTRWKRDYAAKLRDPRWQRKRLEVMQRDNFTCRECGDADSTLNVHHKYYKSGAEPWEYPDTSLMTVCEDCHKELTEEAKERRGYESELLQKVRELGIDPREVVTLLDVFCEKRFCITDVAYAFHEVAIDPMATPNHFVDGLVDVFRDADFVASVVSGWELKIAPIKTPIVATIRESTEASI